MVDFEIKRIQPSRPYNPNGAYPVQVKMWPNHGGSPDVIVRINADAYFALGGEESPKIGALPGNGFLSNGRYYQEFVLRPAAMESSMIFTLVSGSPFEVICIDKIDGTGGQ